VSLEVFFVHLFQQKKMPEMLQNSEGSRSLPEEKWGNGVPPRSIHYTTGYRWK